MPLSSPLEKLDAQGKPLKGYIDPSEATSMAVEGYANQFPIVRGGLATIGALHSAAEQGAQAVGNQIPAVRGAQVATESALTHLNRWMSQIEGAYAGIHAYEASHRHEAHGLRDIYNAAKGGFRRQASHQEAMPGLPGLVADVVQPGVWMAGGPLEGAFKATGAVVKPAAKIAGQAFEEVFPGMAEGAKIARSQVDKPYQYERLGIPKGRAIESEYAAKMHVIDNMPLTNDELQIYMLLPDEKDRKVLAMAVEDGQMDGLTPAQMQAYPYAQHLRDKITKLRIDSGTLSEDAVDGLIEKMSKAQAGAEYFPHGNRAPWKDQVKTIDGVINQLKAQGRDYLGLQNLRNEIETQGKRTRMQVLGDKIRGKPGVKPGYAKERKMVKTLRGMGDLREIINYDAAEALGLSNKQTLRAIAGKELGLDYLDHLNDMGLVHNQPGSNLTHWQMKFEGAPKDVYIPTPIYNKINGISQRMLNPEESLLTLIPVVDDMNRLFRNWALFTRPSTLLMNEVGNLHNNYVALGMGPESAKDYANAASFLIRKKAGVLSTAKKSPVNGLNEVELGKAMDGERIIGTGWSHETGFVGKKAKQSVGQRAKGALGADSPILTPGKKAFSAMEDHSKAAAFINQMNKGQTAREAANNVFNSLFDYELGLTDFERGVLRRIIPFYSWQRFNLPLQVQMFAKNPSRYLNIARTARGAETLVGGPQPDESTWPGYITDNVPFRVYNEKTGEYTVLPLGNIVPSAQAYTMLHPEEAMRQIETSITPWLSVPSQLRENRDALKSTPERPVQIEKFPGQKVNVLGVNLPSKMAFVAKSIPPVRVAQNIREQVQQERGAGGIAQRLGIGYTAQINPTETQKSKKIQLKGRFNELRRTLVGEKNRLKDAKTADQKKQAQANIEAIEKEMSRIGSQLRTD